MEKVIKNGEVAVLYSPGYGAGWYSWGAPIELVFHPKIVEMVLANKQREITPDWLAENIGEEYAKVYCGGAIQLDIEWIPEGTAFVIEEYDGHESIVTYDDLDIIIA